MADTGQSDLHLGRSEREVRVVFVHPGGQIECRFGKAGESIMDVALDNGVQGIRAQCGGGCTCSTCHCYVDEEWFEQCGSMHPDECDILEFAPHRRETSRLSCQIVLEARLDGIRIHTLKET